MSDSVPFAELFTLASGGLPPYGYQTRIAESDKLPDVISVPTGAGKTLAVFVPWVAHEDGPRRLIYALPMRSLVEQTNAVIREANERLGNPVGVYTLMGGAAQHDWRDHPDKRMVIIGTIDMLMSAALNRGYGTSRALWPVAFGLLNSDALWVIDEVQLCGPATTTSAQLAGLRKRFGTPLPTHTIWMSATVDERVLRTVDHPEVGTCIQLTDDDLENPALTKRLEAVKQLERFDASGVAPSELPRALADEVVERHRSKTRTLVVLNRVDTARAVYRAIQKRGPDADVVLLHSRFRPPDRKAHTETMLADPGRYGTIVVATQVIEAGVDMTSALLVTETSPWSSFVQRAGRCNRGGEYEDGASVLWVDRGEPKAKDAAPYSEASLALTRTQLLRLDGSSVAPAVLSGLDVVEVQEQQATLRAADLIDLSDTTPDLQGASTDVAQFVRDGDDRSYSVFFRDTEKVQDEPPEPPGRDELVSVPVGGIGDRRAWQWDFRAKAWEPVRRGGNRAITPGSIVMLDRADGGYSDELGWTGDPKDHPGELDAGSAIVTVEEEDGDLVSVKAEDWVPLSQHLAETFEVAKEITDDLDIPGADRAAVQRAAALHDVGKAHPMFQKMLLFSRPSGEDADKESSGVLWAKSAWKGGHHERRHFRHELASMLALPDEDDIVRYLIAAHHGYLRFSIDALPDEQLPIDASHGSRVVRGIVDGDRLPAVDTPVGTIGPAVLTLDGLAIGDAGSWSSMAEGLREDRGPFVLAYLEALVRVADWRASGA